MHGPRGSVLADSSLLPTDKRQTQREAAKNLDQQQPSAQSLNICFNLLPFCLYLPQETVQATENNVSCAAHRLVWDFTKLVVWHFIQLFAVILVNPPPWRLALLLQYMKYIFDCTVVVQHTRHFSLAHSGFHCLPQPHLLLSSHWLDKPSTSRKDPLLLLPFAPVLAVLL